MRSPRVAVVTIALLAAGATGCTAVGGASGERGALCWDGKDNDDDGTIDCADSECASLAICQDPPRTNGGGGGRRDAGVVIADRGVTTVDSGVKRDATVDGKAPGGLRYGMRCPWDGRTVTECSDGTFCIPPPGGGSGFGYCTHPCSSTPDNCPQPGGGVNARCLYTFNGVDVCTFVCRLSNGQQFSCPSGLSCKPLTSSQYHCWP